jgi:hypothetical protein
MTNPAILLTLVNPSAPPDRSVPVPAATPLPGNFHLWPPSMQQRYRRHALARRGEG